MGYLLTIEYLNGKTEDIYCDSYEEGEQCLTYYIRFGVKSGRYSIPFYNIKRYKIKS